MTGLTYTEISCRDFVRVLASKEPVPGGGGAAALVGAIGTALGQMVGSLTSGKKKYADAEAEISALMEKCEDLKRQLLDQVDADAEGFRPLAEAYGIPKDEPGREEIMEAAIKGALVVPVRIMELSCEAIEAADVFARKGSKLAVSDAGCAAVALKAALEAASLNVFINTKLLKDRSFAKRLNTKVDGMLIKYGAIADGTYNFVRESLLV